MFALFLRSKGLPFSGGGVVQTQALSGDLTERVCCHWLHKKVRCHNAGPVRGQNQSL